MSKVDNKMKTKKNEKRAAMLICYARRHNEYTCEKYINGGGRTYIMIYNIFKVFIHCCKHLLFVCASFL